ncbi:putative subtilisin-like protease, fibronectin type-III domain-containing protein [Helianthus debilis subsp. tardiflorus]
MFGGAGWHDGGLWRWVAVLCSGTIHEGQLNYPSFAMTLASGENKTYSRIVTKVGKANSTYTTRVTDMVIPDGVVVVVHNPTLIFTEMNQKLTYEVTFRRSSIVEINAPYSEGAMAWHSRKYLELLSLLSMCEGQWRSS